MKGGREVEVPQRIILPAKSLSEAICLIFVFKSTGSRKIDARWQDSESTVVYDRQASPSILFPFPAHSSTGLEMRESQPRQDP